MTAPTPQLGADPGMPNVPDLSTALGVTRRSLLRAAPALAVPPLLASPALAAIARPAEAAASPSPVLALFREWEALMARWNGASDDDGEAIAILYADFEARLEAEPARDLTDLAAKVVALTIHGDNGLPRATVAECEALLARGLA